MESSVTVPPPAGMGLLPTLKNIGCSVVARPVELSFNGFDNICESDVESLVKASELFIGSAGGVLDASELSLGSSDDACDSDDAVLPEDAMLPEDGASGFSGGNTEALAESSALLADSDTGDVLDASFGLSAGTDDGALDTGVDVDALFPLAFSDAGVLGALDTSGGFEADAADADCTASFFPSAEFVTLKSTDAAVICAPSVGKFDCANTGIASCVSNNTPDSAADNIRLIFLWFMFSPFLIKVNYEKWAKNCLSFRNAEMRYDQATIRRLLSTAPLQQ
ncbi:MAG: hypothetical protein RR709_07435 [Ruthenibacterium sp.]